MCNHPLSLLSIKKPAVRRCLPSSFYHHTWRSLWSILRSTSSLLLVTLGPVSGEAAPLSYHLGASPRHLGSCCVCPAWMPWPLPTSHGPRRRPLPSGSPGTFPYFMDPALALDTWHIIPSPLLLCGALDVRTSTTAGSTLTSPWIRFIYFSVCDWSRVSVGASRVSVDGGVSIIGVYGNERSSSTIRFWRL